jgi:hypothetical protein
MSRFHNYFSPPRYVVDRRIISGTDETQTGMSGPVLERAKTGRSTCRSSGEPIDQDSWRVGIEAYRAGRMTTTWLKPRCFLDDMLVE